MKRVLLLRRKSGCGICRGGRGTRLKMPSRSPRAACPRSFQQGDGELICASGAYVIVYDEKRQRGLEKHRDTDDDHATLLLLLSRPQRDFVGGGTRFFPSFPFTTPSFDAKPNVGSTIVFSGGIEHEGLPIARGRRLLVLALARRKKRRAGDSSAS